MDFCVVIFTMGIISANIVIVRTGVWEQLFSPFNVPSYLEENGNQSETSNKLSSINIKNNAEFTVKRKLDNVTFFSVLTDEWEDVEKIYFPTVSTLVTGLQNNKTSKAIQVKGKYNTKYKTEPQDKIVLKYKPTSTEAQVIKNHNGNTTDNITEPRDDGMEIKSYRNKIVNIMAFDEENWIKMDNSVADAIAKRVRVLCWIMTHPPNHMTKAIHIKETWGKRCDILLFISTEEDPRLPTLKLNVTEGRMYLWGKVKAAFQHIYENYIDEAEWFLKADDDTYVIVENLKHFLYDYNTNDPIYFGCKYKTNYTKDGYASGGAGYVLSKEAVSRFVNYGLKNDLCVKSMGSEDVDMSRCLSKVEVKILDSRDAYQRARFLPFRPNFHIQVQMFHFWYWDRIYYPPNTGRDCCSEYTISFHYIDNNMMYMLEYFVYHLRPYGITYLFNENI
ncbi:glycoprotein-N-acetylgalactosamine 3-beta-galactosyltransferase 1-like [Plodia interpunctella]|uniref:glycoprotein-N-acetylgalactosamine 3-beta-galactosyltransferase 1-like n=1 Tax=Plodia interpunctella TaxID=58824 RepID=UPI002368D0BA|nr:glycoprotein-N-acetylgalactosamine 3-beta-galactosyltransferase 1-like [Plodia interpunctella]